MNDAYKQLGYAVAIQALKDFFYTTEENKKVIIKDLKSKWMDWLTGGLSVQLAEKLETEPKEVKKRFKKALAKEEENESC